MAAAEGAQPAVNGLLVVEGCAAAEIRRFDQGNAKSTARRFVRASEPMDAAADHEYIVDRALEPR
jgi:hypothetical protein